MQPAFTIRGRPGPVVATAIHAGHALRPEVAAAIALEDAERLREEDPFTDRLTMIADLSIDVDRSRFEVDLNRTRSRAVYRAPEDAWGLQVWTRPPPDDLVARSLEIYDDFYATLAGHLDAIAERGPFVVLDIHSYNHRREGAGAPAAPVDGNPEVNVGTGSLDRTTWADLVERFIDVLSKQEVQGHGLDVRENVRFRGGHVSAWVDERYPSRACTLAIELKKVFMDEWTGAVDNAHVEQLRKAMAATVPELRDSLGGGGIGG